MKEIYFCLDAVYNNNDLVIEKRRSGAYIGNSYEQVLYALATNQSIIITTNTSFLKFMEGYNIYLVYQKVAIRIKPGMKLDDGTVLKESDNLLELFMEGKFHKSLGFSMPNFKGNNETDKP